MFEDGCEWWIVEDMTWSGIGCFQSTETFCYLFCDAVNIMRLCGVILPFHVCMESIRQDSHTIPVPPELHKDILNTKQECQSLDHLRHCVLA